MREVMDKKKYELLAYSKEKKQSGCRIEKSKSDTEKENEAKIREEELAEAYKNCKAVKVMNSILQ